MYDNGRPVDPDYPTFEPAVTAYNPLPMGSDGENCIVDVGDYIVERDGDVMIATTSNRCPYKVSEVYRLINEGFIRAKYIGNEDDSGVCANQIRLCTPEEVAAARHYKQPGRVKVAKGGQVVLL